MSITIANIHFIIDSVVQQINLKKQVAVLSIGRQAVFFTPEHFHKILKKRKITPNNKLKNPLFQNFIQGDRYKGFLNDNALFEMLGVSYETIDISNYQKANHIQDLNQKINSRLKNKFDLIIDGGSLEHIFNIPQALENLASMLKMNGRIIHMNTVNGYVDHGYFQISPLLYEDYYNLKQFKIISSILAEHPTEKANYKKWFFWAWDKSIKRKYLLSNKPLGLIFIAEKTIKSNPKANPIQRFDKDSGYSYADKELSRKPWGLTRLNLP